MGRSLSGYATTIDPVEDIVCAYTTSPTQIPANADTPPIVIGEFSVPTAVRCRLEIIGFVSAAGVTVTAAIYNPTLMQGSNTYISDRIAAKSKSQPVDLVPGVVYQICAACVGWQSPLNFGVVRTAGIGAP